MRVKNSHEHQNPSSYEPMTVLASPFVPSVEPLAQGRETSPAESPASTPFCLADSKADSRQEMESIDAENALAKVLAGQQEACRMMKFLMDRVGTFEVAVMNEIRALQKDVSRMKISQNTAREPLQRAMHSGASNSSGAGESSSGFMGASRIRDADSDVDLGVQSGHFSSLAGISPNITPWRGQSQPGQGDSGRADVFSV